jgi:uncharacterized membrane protein
MFSNRISFGAFETCAPDDFPMRRSDPTNSGLPENFSPIITSTIWQASLFGIANDTFTLMKRPILYSLSLVLVMLVTGVFWGTWFTLTRSLSDFPADNFIRIGKTIIANVATPMSILMPATLIVLLWLCVDTFRVRPSFYFFAGALVLMIVTLIITVGVEVPIDNLIKTWTPETIPSDWTDLRATWDRYHALRTLTSVLSFVLLSVGVVNGGWKGSEV